jgi:hypothetical protein
VKTNRRCSKIIIENIRVLNSVFNDQSFKDLFILKAINDYNYYIKRIDQTDIL